MTIKKELIRIKNLLKDTGVILEEEVQSMTLDELRELEDIVFELTGKLRSLLGERK